MRDPKLAHILVEILHADETRWLSLTVCNLRVAASHSRVAMFYLLDSASHRVYVTYMSQPS